MADDTIRCPMHGAKFDMKTGEPLTNKRLAPLKTVAVSIEGDFVTIGPPESGS